MIISDRVIGFGRLLHAHVRVHWLSYCLIALVLYMFQENYRIGINETPSLPQTFFFIQKNAHIAKGDYVSFRVPPSKAAVKVNPSMILTKIAVGVAGDVVTVSNRVVYVNGVPAGYAKEYSLKKEPLDPIDPIVVPPGSLYVMGLHRDSLDSRYTIVGLVSESTVVGKAYPIL